MNMHGVQLRRVNSFLTVREFFPQQQPNEEEIQMEKEIQKLMIKLMLTDIRNTTTILGSGVCAFLGLVIFSTSGVGALAGVVIGAGIGRFIGKRIGLHKKSQYRHKKLLEDDMYKLRLLALLAYGYNQSKTKNFPLEQLAMTLEKIVIEFYPSFELHEQYKSLISKLKDLLLKKRCKLALLYSAQKFTEIIEQYIRSVKHYKQLQFFFIPVRDLLQKKKGTQQEYVNIINSLLEQEHIQYMIKLVPKINNTPQFRKETEKILSETQEMALKNRKENIDLMSVIKNKRDLLLRRCNSMSQEESDFLCSRISTFRDLQKFQLINILNNAEEYQFLKQQEVQQQPGPLPQQPEMIPEENKQENQSQMELASQMSINSQKSKGSSQGQAKQKSQSNIVVATPIKTPFKNQPSTQFFQVNEIELIQNAIEEEQFQQNIKQNVSHNELQSNRESLVNQSFIKAKEEKKALLNQILDIEKQPLHGKLWKQVVDKSHCQVYKQTKKDDPVVMIRAVCIVPYVPQIVFQAIWEPPSRSLWDKVLTNLTLIESDSVGDVIHYNLAVPAMCQKRDFCQRRVMMHDYPEEGSITCHYTSIEHPAVPVRKGIIRCETVISGYIIRPKPDNKSQITIFTKTDIKGLVPKMIVNMVASRAPLEWVKNLESGCQKIVAKNK